MHETPQDVKANPAIAGTPIKTPREKLAAAMDAIAARYGVHPHRLYGDGVPGRTTPTVYAARREAILTVIDARPWWSYAQVADYLNLTDDTVYKHARKAGHRRNGLRSKGGAE